MKISKISFIPFRAEELNTAKSEDNKQIKEDSEKQSTFDKLRHDKRTPYALGATALATVIIGILAVKHGNAKRLAAQAAKNADVKPTEAPSGATKPNPEALSPKEPSVISGKEEKVNLANEIVSEPEKNTEIINMGPWDDSELLDNVARVDVAESEFIPDIIKQAKNYKYPLMDKAYITKFMDNFDIIEGLKDGSFTPMKRINLFIKDLDNSVEEQIRNINDQYPIINNILSGYHRYKNDFVKAFNNLIRNENSGYKGSYKVVGNTIEEMRPNSSKVIYTFEEGEKGGLISVKEIPQNPEGTSVEVSFIPERYNDLGRGIGIHHLDSIEFKDMKTGNITEKISIDPEERSFHNFELFDRKTGKQVISVKRTAGPNNLYYNTEMTANDGTKFTVDTKTGEGKLFLNNQDGTERVVDFK